MRRMHQDPRPRRRRLAAGAVAVAGVCALAAGCGGSDQPDSTQSTSSSASATGTSDASSPAGSSSAATGTGSPSASDAGSVTPASGPPVSLTAVALNYPAGWEVQSKDAISIVGFDPAGASRGQLLVDDQSGYDSDTVDSLAKSEMKFATVKPLTRGENRTVGGVEGYTLTGSDSRAKTYYAWGGPVDGRAVEIQFLFLGDAPDAQSVIDSVLASVTFH